MHADIYWIAGGILSVGIITVFTERMARLSVLPLWLSRKILHFLAIGGCALMPLVLEKLELLIALVCVAEVALVYLVARRILFPDESGRPGYGIALFPIAYVLLMLIFADSRERIAYAMGILALCDATAAVAGHVWARRFYQLTGDKKSLTGNIAFFIPAAILMGAGLQEGYTGPETWVLAWVTALMLTAFEAMGSKGADNILVPLAAGGLLGIKSDAGIMAAGAVAALLFAWVTWRKGWLTADGAVAAALTGLWILAFRPPEWLIPLFFFFAGSVAVGKIFKTAEPGVAAKHGKARDWKQVVCNGGVYAVLCTFPGTDFNMAICVSAAVSTADTWASETGLYFRKRTFNLLTLQPVPPGLSGGVSVPGTLGAIAGAFMTAFICLLLPGISLQKAVWIGLAGVAGMLLDSALGASLQAKYQIDGSPLLEETPTPGARLAKGLGWLDNDRVNLASNALVSVLALLFTK